VVESWDALNFRSATTYTPATGGPVTQTVDTNPRGWTTTAVVEPGRGLAKSTVDINGLRTDVTYDGLGRLTAVWQPGRQKDVDPADARYAYTVRRDGATAVTTQQLNPAGGYITSHALYDGLLRPRQTQTASPAGGRILTDTFFDTAGRPVRGFDVYYATGAPSVDLVAATDAGTVPKQTRTVYDGAGRAAHSIFQPYGVERWRTSTVYGGDYTTVIPPPGGTASTSFVDSRGHQTTVRQYRGNAATGGHDDTVYRYNRKGLLESVTDPAGNAWTFGYDILGRRTSMTDPDSGTTQTTYDAASRITTTTDSRQRKLAYSYDNLGRRTGVYLNSPTGTRVAGWSYDTVKLPDGVTSAKGALASSTRFVGPTPTPSPSPDTRRRTSLPAAPSRFRWPRLVSAARTTSVPATTGTAASTASGTPPPVTCPSSRSACRTPTSGCRTR
jgi:YD repeat-containing protein